MGKGKLSVQINRESSKIQSLVKEYNACELVGDVHTKSLSASNVFDPSVLEDHLNS